MTEALESFAFNVAVARLYELANALTDAERRRPAAEPGLDWARREAMEVLARLSAPMMPHLAEEVMACLNPGSATLVAELPWPEAEPDLLIADSVTIAVQIMGKLRGTVAMPPDAPAEAVIAAAEAEPHVAHALDGQTHRPAHPCAQPHRQFRDRRMRSRHGRSPNPGPPGRAAAWPRRSAGRVWLPPGLHADRQRSRAPPPGLAEIEVKPIYERPGQILREALLGRLGIEPARRASSTST